MTLWETVLAALVVFLGPYTWLIVSAASETNLGILRWLRKAWNYIKSRDYLFAFAIAVGSYIFAFEYLLYLLPMFVTEDFVRATSAVFLTVEGFIFPLTTQIKGERERHNAVLIAVVAVAIGAMTVTLANFQSLQLHSHRQMLLRLCSRSTGRSSESCYGPLPSQFSTQRKS